MIARIVAAKKSYAQGKLISIEKPSPFRTKPECPAYHACGGCQISHLTYEGQLLVKEQRVKDVVSRLGGFSEDLVLPVLPAENPWNYRNKMAVPVAQATGGPVIDTTARAATRWCPLMDASSRKKKTTGSSVLLRASWQGTASRDTTKNPAKAPCVT